MIAPSQIPNPYVKPRWQAPVGVMESVVAYNCRKYGMPLPVLAMPMWEGAGNRAIDLSGHGNHGTLKNGASWTANGLYFDGVNDFIDITGITSGTTNTFFGIFKRENSDFIFDTQYGRLVIDFGLYGTANYLSIYDGSWKSFDAVPSNEWMSIAVVFNGSSSQATGYLNGNKLGSTLAYVPKNIGSATSIASYFNGTNIQHYKGFMDSFSIFPTALTAAQVKFLYDNPYFMYRMPEELYGYAAAAAGVSIPVFMHHYNQLRGA